MRIIASSCYSKVFRSRTDSFSQTATNTAARPIQNHTNRTNHDCDDSFILYLFRSDTLCTILAEIFAMSMANGIIIRVKRNHNKSICLFVFPDNNAVNCSTVLICRHIIITEFNTQAEKSRA